MWERVRCSEGVKKRNREGGIREPKEKGRGMQGQREGRGTERKGRKKVKY